MPDPCRLHETVTAYLRLYHRHEVEFDRPLPEPPSLIVGTHGFGGIIDLNVLSDGQRLAARVPGLRRLRLKTLPISLSIPWGLNIGLVGLLPYAALPTKLRTVVMAPMTPRSDENGTDFAARIERAMQARSDQLVAHRKVILG